MNVAEKFENFAKEVCAEKISFDEFNQKAVDSDLYKEMSSSLFAGFLMHYTIREKKITFQDKDGVGYTGYGDAKSFFLEWVG